MCEVNSHVSLMINDVGHLSMELLTTHVSSLMFIYSKFLFIKKKSYLSSYKQQGVVVLSGVLGSKYCHNYTETLFGFFILILLWLCNEGF